MFKLLAILAMLTLLSACEQQKQASAEVGAIPKTIIDMCKAADRGMIISEIKLLEKQGGKSGDWIAAG